MGFPNKAGDHADTDDILRAELKAAGIPTLQEGDGEPPDFMRDFLRRTSGEVKTSVRGHLYGWTFERAWYYWMCSGPGIEIAAAQRLQDEFGKTVRASGDCGCRGPRFWFKGLACGSYHVDDAEGLKALADTIRALVEGSAVDGVQPSQAMSALQAVFLDLLQQVDAFIEQQGEADFYTGPARAMRALLTGRKPTEHLQLGLDKFLAECGITGVAEVEPSRKEP